ncbi:NTP transferase domain-containing protein [Streptomyces sp. Je 1-369]|uniref:NTP transferase domain-containing protein n=1 Tax=Streptomyces sp. Je 1-369 TaxID=2966192 RepID=UPI002286AD53|nr:NTP transferase domain-containing protein [Streptomyces sp. Je 1-369]WAL96679.1 NTP transferase domain-containing protein [Streptomyces sp. Je 1-369]
MTTNVTTKEGGPYDAVVLAGGGAARLGGADKPGVRVGGRALLDRVLAACSGAGTTVVVAAPRPTVRPVVWAREEPAGGGPLAALDAGLARTTAERVVVLSADLPFLGAQTVSRLLAALAGSGADGAVLTDPEGRDQPLVAAYRRAALLREIAALDGRGSDGGGGHDGRGSHGGGGLAGLPLRRLTGRLSLTRVADPLAAFDCDTWDDIASARARIREHGNVLDEWISAVKDELGIELDVDTGALLDLARDAAHGVARPAAPLTTFLVGYAAAQAAARGGAAGGAETVAGAVAEATRKAAALAARWADEDQQDAKPGTPAPGSAQSGSAMPGSAQSGSAKPGPPQPGPPQSGSPKPGTAPATPPVAG